MIKNKEKIIQQAEEVAKGIYNFSAMIEKLEDHEEQTALQVIDELGFEEDLTTIGWKFDNAAEMLKETEVIDGYQVYIGQASYASLNVITQNRHIQIARSKDLEEVFEILLNHIENRQQAKNIFKWYFEQVY